MPCLNSKTQILCISSANKEEDDLPFNIIHVVVIEIVSKINDLILYNIVYFCPFCSD